MSMDRIVADLKDGSAGPECMLWTDPSLGCCIAPEDMARLCEALTAHGKVRTLSLSGNTIHDASAKVLAGWLATCCGVLKVVDLSFCGLRSEAVAEVVRRISLNPGLADVLLNVSFNEVDAAGSGLLVDALERSTRAGLKHLVLRYNPLVARGVAALVATNGYLETLDCSYCGVVDVSPIEDALRGTKLSTIRLCGLDVCIQKQDVLNSTAARAKCTLLLTEDIVCAESPAGAGAQSPTLHSPEIEAKYFKEELALLHDSVSNCANAATGSAGSPLAGLRLPSPVNVRLFPNTGSGGGSPPSSAPHSPTSLLDYASGRVLHTRGGAPIAPSADPRDTSTCASSPPPRLAPYVTDDVAAECVKPAPALPYGDPLDKVATASNATAASTCETHVTVATAEAGEAPAAVPTQTLTFTALRKSEVVAETPAATEVAPVGKVTAGKAAKDRRDTTASPTVRKKKVVSAASVSVSPMAVKKAHDATASPKRGKGASDKTATKKGSGRQSTQKRQGEGTVPSPARCVQPPQDEAAAREVPHTPVRGTSRRATADDTAGDATDGKHDLAMTMHFTPTGSSPPRAALSPTVCGTQQAQPSQSEPPAGYAPTIKHGDAKEPSKDRRDASKPQQPWDARSGYTSTTSPQAPARAGSADDATLKSLSLALNVLSEKCNALTGERDDLQRELSAEVNRRIAAEMEAKLLKKEMAAMKEQFASQVQRLAKRDTSPQPRHKVDSVATPTHAHTRRSVSPKAVGAAAAAPRSRRPLTDAALNTSLSNTLLERSPTNPRAGAAKVAGRTPCRSPTKQSRSPTRSHSLSKMIKRRHASASAR